MSTASPRPVPRPWPKWLSTAGWTILTVLGVTLVVFIATVTFGAVHGSEFCPQTFSRRSYSYYQLPLLGIQLTGERHEDLTGKVEQLVKSKSYVTTPAGGQEDWHVLEGSQGPRLRQLGDADILVRYLDATDVGSNLRWENWTEEHADLAKILWPAAQKLALANHYIVIPDLFDLTKTITDPQEFQTATDKLLSTKLPKAKAQKSAVGDEKSTAN